MRAIAVEQLKGEPRLVDLLAPQPKPDQLLVRVAAAGINPFDWKLADGAMKGVVPNVLPFVMGLDAAGTVVGVGAKVSHFKLGDRVFGQFFHTPLGEGTYAEYTVVPESGAVALLPRAVNDEVAAALPTSGMTALSLIDTLGFSSGANILIVGATGGVGSFATQLAAAKGAHVMVTADEADAQRMRELGAMATFDYRAGDLGAQIKDHCPGGLDGLIDLVSDAPTFASLTRLVRKGGHVLTTIGSADEKALHAQGIQGGNFQLHASPALLQSLAIAVEVGRLRVPVEAVVTLEDAPAAIARMRAGHARGKTVIRIAAA